MSFRDFFEAGKQTNNQSQKEMNQNIKVDV